MSPLTREVKNKNNTINPNKNNKNNNATSIHPPLDRPLRVHLAHQPRKGIFLELGSISDQSFRDENKRSSEVWGPTGWIKNDHEHDGHDGLGVGTVVKTQEPQKTVGMRIVAGGSHGRGGSGEARNSRHLPVGADGREWSHGLLCNGGGGLDGGGGGSGCSSDAFKTCLSATVCPGVVYAKNKRRLEHLTVRGYPDPERGGPFLSPDCLGFYWRGPWLQTLLRRAIRSRYDIEGTIAGDVCTVLCCGPCDLTQGYQELELEESSIGVRYF